MEALAERGVSLLDSISDFCRHSGIAESTFGRRAVNVPLRHAHAADRDRGQHRHLDATRDVLQAHGGLWFLDETYVVSRKRG